MKLSDKIIMTSFLLLLIVSVILSIVTVVADGKKEFYQSAWDAFSSELHMKNVTAKIIKIPVVPMSNDEIKAESVAFELGKKRHYPHVEEFTNSKPRRKVTFLQVAEAFAIITWIISIIVQAEELS